MSDFKVKPCLYRAIKAGILNETVCKGLVEAMKKAKLEDTTIILRMIKSIKKHKLPIDKWLPLIEKMVESKDVEDTTTSCKDWIDYCKYPDNKAEKCETIGKLVTRIESV